jgi:hypothetical protein
MQGINYYASLAKQYLTILDASIDRIVRRCCVAGVCEGGLLALVARRRCHRSVEFRIDRILVIHARMPIRFASFIDRLSFLIAHRSLTRVTPEQAVHVCLYTAPQGTTRDMRTMRSGEESGDEGV